MTFVPMNSTALIGVDEKDAGVASVLVNATQQIGGALGTAFLKHNRRAPVAADYLATSTGPAVARIAAVHGYTTAFTVSAGLLVAAAVAAAVIVLPLDQSFRGSPRTPNRPTPPNQTFAEVPFSSRRLSTGCTGSSEMNVTSSSRLVRSRLGFPGR